MQTNFFFKNFTQKFKKSLFHEILLYTRQKTLQKNAKCVYFRWKSGRQWGNMQILIFWENWLKIFTRGCFLFWRYVWNTSITHTGRKKNHLFCKTDSFENSKKKVTVVNCGLRLNENYKNENASIWAWNESHCLHFRKKPQMKNSFGGWDETFQICAKKSRKLESSTTGIIENPECSKLTIWCKAERTHAPELRLGILGLKRVIKSSH